MRLSVKKGARTRSTPPNFTGNPGERSGGTCSLRGAPLQFRLHLQLSDSRIFRCIIEPG
jgi:hypothetical protein